MARLALLDPARKSLATVEALAGRVHQVLPVPDLDSSVGHDLLIYDLDSTGTVPLAGLAGLAMPVVVLADQRRPLPKGLAEGPGLVVLRKPFDPLELRVVIKRGLARTMAGRPGGEPAQAPAEGWLDFPFVSQAQASVLSRAALVDGPVWLIGEEGSGRRRMLAELARRVPERTGLTHWQGATTLTSLLERAAKARLEPTWLLVHGIDSAEREQQDTLVSLLETEPGLRLLATTTADPAEDAVDGRFSPGLYQRMSALTVQLAPLRERRLAIVPMVELLLARAAARLGVGDVSLAPGAAELLQDYMWPGNLVELESVLVRSLVRLENVTGHLLLDRNDIRFTNDDGPLPGRAETGTGRGLPVSPLRPGDGSEQASFAGLVASLSHELRNGLTPVSTVLQVLAAREEPDEQLGGLITEALAGCNGLDELAGLLEGPGQLGECVAEELDLEELVSETLAGADLGAKVAVEPASVAFRVHADRGRVRLMLRCVLAAAASESGGEPVGLAFEEPATLTVHVERARGGAAGLQRVGESALPWQTALAQMLAQAEGARLTATLEGGSMKVALEFSGIEEEEEDGKAQGSNS